MEKIDDIVQQAKALPREIAPERDLWPAIAAEIETPERSSFWQLRLAASVFAATVLIGLMLGSPEEGKDTGKAAATLPSLNAQLVRHMPFDDNFLLNYREAIAELDEQLDALPPGTREVIAGNLEIVRESIEEINAAIDRDPNNVQLRQLLQLAYRQEMAIISMVRDSVVGAEQIRTTI
ncbi:MAG: hypothetical protein AAF290_16000 [Pseudomonadota bacterium]